MPALDEPTVDVPTTPSPGFESIVKDPFRPFDIGPPEALWQYESLTAEEKAVVDRGRTQPTWQATADGYGGAVRERAGQAAAAAAAQQLGTENLAALGVVP